MARVKVDSYSRHASLSRGVLLAGHMPHLPRPVRQPVREHVTIRRPRHRPAVDLTGRTFGSLQVLERGPRIGGRTAWWCACSCGGRTLVQTSHLTRAEDCGRIRTCGHERRWGRAHWEPVAPAWAVL